MTRTHLLPCALLGALSLAPALHAGVIISCDAVAEVRFINVEEFTEGLPAGRDGLRFLNHTTSFDTIGGTPPQAFHAAVSYTSGELGDYDGLLPRLGDGWNFAASMFLNLPGPGFGMATQQAVLDLSFLNTTAGASIYALDVEIDWSLRFRVDRPDELSDTATLFAVGYGSQRVGDDLIPFDGPQVVVTTDTPETVVRHTSILHLEVGRAPADSALIQLTLTTQGYGSSTVPSVGPACVFAMGLALVGFRRSRRRG